ncbi:hypothetical protein OE766_11720 [Pararhizobium sp. YC-54]|uniref:hypothetical protein n=1 Tax=Pararhizobium sp. YC-54 TaxID=2986920 RepID=UPI0021F6F129|nr:hypothetical protein [Pararhizobium sp. YC-54]MCV9998919.1 hypothetical protein [Pararhizobium sp. YC-54]
MQNAIGYREDATTVYAHAGWAGVCILGSAVSFAALIYYATLLRRATRQASAFPLFSESRKRSSLFVFAQFRTQNRYALVLEYALGCSDELII